MKSNRLIPRDASPCGPDVITPVNRISFICCAIHYPFDESRFWVSGDLADEVVVVTAPDDHQMHSLVGDGSKFTLVSSKHLFHAAHEKSAAINLGIEAIKDRTDWVALIDADVAFSTSDRERLDHLLPLVAAEDVLVGLAGRRICSGSLIPRESPRTNLARQTTPIGYFQGFRLDRDPCRYPGKDDPGWRTLHDDWRFYELFGDERCVALPFACYHIGKPGINWGGYSDGNTADHFSVDRIANSPTGEPFRRVLNGGNVLLLEAFGCGDTIDLLEAAGVKSVHVVDPWELNQSPVERVQDLPPRLQGITGWKEDRWSDCRQALLRGRPCPPLEECVTPLFLKLIAADRRFTRERFENAIAPYGKRVCLLGDEGTDVLNEVKECSLRAIWIAGEIRSSTILEEIANWRGKLAEDAYIGGGFFDVVNWSESAAIIQMLLGTPDIVTPDGQWLFKIEASDFEVNETAGSYPLTLPLIHGVESDLICSTRGVVFFQASLSDCDRILLSLHALRTHWRGEIVVLFCGGESLSLRIACARYRAHYRETPGPSKKGDERVVERSAVDSAKQVAEFSPFERTLWIESGLVGRIDEILAWEKLKDAPPGVTRLKPGSEQSAGSEAAELALLREWAPRVRVRRGADLVIAITPEDLGYFERNWTATRWQAAVQSWDEKENAQNLVGVKVMTDTVSSDRIQHAMRHSSQHADIIELDVEAESEEPVWIEALLAAAVISDAEWLIYLDPMMHPSPGAELFLEHRLSGADIATPSWGFRLVGELELDWILRLSAVLGSPDVPNKYTKGNLLKHMHLGPATMLIRRKWLLDAIKKWESGFTDVPFEIFATLLCRFGNGSMESCRPLTWGWDM